MSIKKLTAAAAIAVGIATCSLTSAMAACPCTQNEALPVVTGPSDCANVQKLIAAAKRKRLVLLKHLATMKSVVINLLFHQQHFVLNPENLTVHK